jgi:integrase
MASPKTLPKGVNLVWKTLRSGERVRYGYFGRGPGAVALGREGTPEFFERLSEAMRREPAGGTVRNLIWRYKQSPEYARLSPRSRSDYAQQLDRVEAKFGALSLRAMVAREITRHIWAWRDSMAKSPRRADYAVQVLKALLSWGVKRGLVDHNRAAGVGRLYHSDRRECVWTDDQVSAFLATASEPLKRALVMAIETGQRQGDLLVLPWSSVDSGTLRLRQHKTGARVAVPISADLQGCLDGAPRGRSVTILTRPDGLPWDPKGNGFRAAWRDACKAAKVTGVTFHDLRGSFVTRRLAAGWTTQEVAMCTGHSLRDLASLDTYADRGTVADASAERISQRTRESGK